MPSQSAQHGSFVLTPILSPEMRVRYLLGIAVWVAALAYFWIWWLDPAHIASTGAYLLVTTSVAWVTLIPLYFIVIYFSASKPAGSLEPVSGLRVAMVVTKAPSEPFSLVAETLKAMLAQDYPHDTWLADEDPSPQTIAWCAERGVKLSTRRGVESYHQRTWPRRTRCKEGNLAYFYDHFGYANYDVVSQLDADHVPSPGYLRQMVRPFADPAVGYVSAPSICDSNAARSWSARGRLYAEANMHGALQAGYNGGWAPLCIGSHYAVRTKALQEIGGLGPELAEDHSTTLMMNAFGWRGIHAIDAIARGAGPDTFADLATQEFQWSRSLVTILLKYSPTYIPRLPTRLKFQFLFSQLWYPLFSIFLAISYLMPIAALLLRQNLVNVDYPAFLIHFAPVTIVLIALAHQWRAHGAFRPVDAKVISWETVVFLFARWPWTLAGSIAAVYEHLADKYVDFRVTPKGAAESSPVPWRVLAPYAALSLASALPAVFVENAGPGSGFYVFAVVNAVLYGAILVTILVGQAVEQGAARRRPSYFSKVGLAMAALLVLPAASLAQHGLAGLAAISDGTGYFALTEVTYTAAGAGAPSGETIRFAPRWTSADE